MLAAFLQQAGCVDFYYALLADDVGIECEGVAFDRYILQRLHAAGLLVFDQFQGVALCIDINAALTAVYARQGEVAVGRDMHRLITHHATQMAHAHAAFSADQFNAAAVHGAKVAGVDSQAGASLAGAFGCRVLASGQIVIIVASQHADICAAIDFSVQLD